MVAISGRSKPLVATSGCECPKEALGAREHKKAEKVGGGGDKVRQVSRRWSDRGADDGARRREQENGGAVTGKNAWVVIGLMWGKGERLVGGFLGLVGTTPFLAPRAS